MISFFSCAHTQTSIRQLKSPEEFDRLKAKLKNSKTISEVIKDYCSWFDKTCNLLMKKSLLLKPSELSIKPLYSFPKHITYSIDGLQTGVIKLKDGAAEYWFISHHGANDRLGQTIVKMSDGSVMLMKGWFCCEVNFGGVKSLSDMKNFLRIYNGILP